MEKFKSGFVSILGRSNVGKSTLLNALVGSEVAMVSPKPQTTRHHIKGILSLENAQIIFSDTPGIFTPRKKMDRLMVRSAYSSIKDVDLLLLVVEPVKGRESFINDYDKNILKKFASVDCPKYLVVNKIDNNSKGDVLSAIKLYNGSYGFDQTVPVSAKSGRGLEKLLALVIETMPEGPRYFPKEMVTDRREDFLVSEMIRQQIIMLARQEVPYQTAVVVENIQENDKLIKIFSRIIVASEAHKRIIVGAKGRMVKEIGTRARRRIEKALGKKVFLEILVKVKPDWPEDANFLSRENIVG